MTIQELVPLGPKTTMRIGGKAKYFAELMTETDVEEAWIFSQEKAIPLIPLGGGSNTIFADDVIDALVVRIKKDDVIVHGSGPSRSGPEGPSGPMAARWQAGMPAPQTIISIHAGKILGSLLNELAEKNLDLSALTGIPGTLGGALFGNAGQGPKGVWLDTFVESVTALIDGAWKTFTREECKFRYRESAFKDLANQGRSVIIWKASLRVPSRPAPEIKGDIETLLKKRIETQPHLKTAGSCFKALPDGTPAWKLIDAAGLRGRKIGGVQISEKHANFLLNVEKGTFDDAVNIAALIKKDVPQIAGIEMRLYDASGKIL